MCDDTLDVSAAYALKSPQDSQRLYARWAKTYDADFAVRKQFLMPGHVAEIYRARGGVGPVLDAGAGTGLLGAALCAGGPMDIDALDISPEMLAEAARKGVYRHCVAGDLTAKLPFKDATYAGVVSSGTFTHGHVGPEALPELLRVATPSAFFVLTIKAAHFNAMGFARTFDDLANRIDGFETTLRPMYGVGEDDGSAEGLIAMFRKR